MDWGGALDDTTMLCFICHQNDTLTDSSAYTHSGKVANNSYDIENEYNDPADLSKLPTERTAGHIIRYDPATLGPLGFNLAQGDKMPCFNCHDSHQAFDYLSPTGVQNAKLLRWTVNPYGTSTGATPFTMGNVLDGNDNGLIDDERPVCAGCHATGLAASEPNSNGTVKGITPMDPVVSSAIHACNGIGPDLSNPAGWTYTGGCIQPTDLSPAGCHRNTHNPTIGGGDPPGPGMPCYSCHGSGCGSAIQVNDRVIDTWGRGGDFGDENLNTKIANGDPDIKSTHNILFNEANPGNDPSPGVRGSCTVCHTTNNRPNGINYHGDGDPRNDFRDVDPDPAVDPNELQNLVSGRHAPIFINDSEGYRYEPEWLLCVDCHDDPAVDTAKDYYDLIGDTTKFPPLNLDEFMSIPPSPEVVYREFVYGTGDYDNLQYHIQAPDNSTPVKNYNQQPYKAHYYQTDGTLDPSVVWPGGEIGILLTNPTLATYSDFAKERIINCLDCHYGHGGKNASMYRSPDPLYTSNHPTGIDNANGRDICLDCHNETPGQEVLLFPVSTQVTKGGLMIPAAGTNIRRMWVPPLNNRYGNPIQGSDGAGGIGNPHDPSDPIGSTIRCNGGDSTSLFRCHNTHSPSCETCHAYPVSVPGGLDAP